MGEEQGLGHASRVNEQQWSRGLTSTVCPEVLLSTCISYT